MATIEELDIIIRILDRYSRKIDGLLLQLGELEGVAESVEKITIDVDVRGEGKLTRLMAQLAAIKFMDRDINVGVRGAAAPRTPSIPTDVFDTDKLAKAISVSFADVLDEKGDDIFEGLVPQIRGMSESLRRAERNGGLFNLRMEDMHNALAKLIPLLLVFIGALPALITAVVALATAMVAAVAAFGAIAGLGALGFAMARADGQMPALEDFTEILDTLIESFFEAFAPLAERLLPTFERALRGVGVLFQRIADRGETLMALRSQFNAFGRFLLEWIPDVLNNLGRMAIAFEGVFAIIGQFFRETSFIEGLTNFFADALPALVKFGSILAEITPILIRISIGMLAVSNSVVRFLMFIGELISHLRITAESFGILLGTLLTFITVGAILNGAVLPRLVGMLVLIGKLGLAGLAGKFTATASAMITTAAATGILTTAIQFLTGAGITLLAATGIGLLLPVLGSIGSQFLGVSQDVREATNALREFDSVGRRIDGVNPYGPTPTVGGEAALRRGTVSGRRGGSTIVVNGNADDQALERAVARVNYANYRSTFRP